ncbi:MAG: DUF4827 domain-containing protein [Prevotella sp.]|jgi:hypothetical protein|nr:DUF4827 domain-containing protein [Prevotella sp.]
MNKIIYTLLFVFGLISLTSCNDYETYADLKEKEQDAISNFIAREGIQVIDEATFKNQGETTDTTRNQFVYMSRTGVYMQILRKGCGSPLEDKKSISLLCRFMEKNLLTDSVLIRNDQKSSFYLTSIGQYIDTSQYVDKMFVTRNGTTITAMFESGMMQSYHSSTSVPGGWLVPLNYINVGRPEKEGDQIAKVRLIVPHSQGTADASSTVFPCYYEISYERVK